jgi:hypothetical protein
VGDMLMFVPGGERVRLPMMNRAVLVLGWRVDGEQSQVFGSGVVPVNMYTTFDQDFPAVASYVF